MPQLIPESSQSPAVLEKPNMTISTVRYFKVDDFACSVLIHCRMSKQCLSQYNGVSGADGLNRRQVMLYRVDLVRCLRGVIEELSRAADSPESHQAAQLVVECLNAALAPINEG
jgi:hypothetical protein